LEWLEIVVRGAGAAMEEKQRQLAGRFAVADDPVPGLVAAERDLPLGRVHVWFLAERIGCGRKEALCRSWTAGSAGARSRKHSASVPGARRRFAASSSSSSGRTRSSSRTP